MINQDNVADELVSNVSDTHHAVGYKQTPGKILEMVQAGESSIAYNFALLIEETEVHAWLAVLK